MNERDEAQAEFDAWEARTLQQVNDELMESVDTDAHLRRIKDRPGSRHPADGVHGGMPHTSEPMPDATSWLGPAEADAFEFEDGFTWMNREAGLREDGDTEPRRGDVRGLDPDVEIYNGTEWVPFDSSGPLPGDLPERRWQHRQGQPRRLRQHRGLMSGDHIRQYGAGSIGQATHSGSGDIVAGGKYVQEPEAGASPLDNLLKEVQELRQHLDASDRAEVDATVEEIRSNPSEERFGKLLRRITGIAAVIGEAGVPVIAAVKALLGSS